MKRTAAWLAAFGALCAAALLAAQTATAAQSAPAQQAVAPSDQPPADPGIVVNGKTQTPSGNEVFDQARGISRVTPYETYVVALPRFWSPVCPGVAGLRPDYAEAMVDRMRSNIARLKAPLAKRDCSANLVVAFEDDGRSLLSDLERNRPEIFELVSQAERQELLTDPAPVHVWSNIMMRWTGAGPPPPDGVKASVWGQVNRNAMPESYDILGALVVFDRGAVEGMTLTQLADYATMRGLAHTRTPDGEQPMTTILSLFNNGGASPGELTDFDVGYLRSLYWWAPNASAAHRFADVQRWTAKAAKETAKP